MDAWLRAQLARKRRPAPQAQVTAIVAQLPKDVLVALAPGDARAARELRLRRRHRAHPGAAPRRDRDDERRRRARADAARSGRGDAAWSRATPGLELGELATSRRGLNVVEGRTIGLLLPTESPGPARRVGRRAARRHVGPRAAARRARRWTRGPPPRPRRRRARRPRPQCAPLEAAPPLDEPGARASRCASSRATTRAASTAPRCRSTSSRARARASSWPASTRRRRRGRCAGARPTASP